MPAAATKHLPLNDIVLIPELSPRARLCEETVIRYMESFPSLPPVRVQRDTNVVIDGYHRVEAATRLGLELVPVTEESIPDEELKMVAGLANVTHGQPLTRQERNQLAVALVRTYGRTREEVGDLLGMGTSAVTLALREHQLNEQLSEKLGTPVQVINSSHVRALYRVGAEQREQLLEAVVSKVDENGQPYPLTGAELKLLVDRMLDPATPTAELNRLLRDPKARPRVTSVPQGDNGRSGADAFVPEESTGAKPWEREWQSPLKGGDTEAFDRVAGVDEQLDREGASAGRDRQLNSLLDRAERNVNEQGLVRERTTGDDPAYGQFWGKADGPGGAAAEEYEDGAMSRTVRQRIQAATTALEDLVPKIEVEGVRTQLSAVLELLKSALKM